MVMVVGWFVDFLIVKTCKSLTHRLMATVIDGTSKDQTRNIVRSLNAFFFAQPLIPLFKYQSKYKCFCKKLIMKIIKIYLSLVYQQYYGRTFVYLP